MNDDFSIDELVTCIQRELAMRKHVYPSWVSRGRMTQQEADRQIAMLSQVIRILETHGEQGQLL